MKRRLALHAITSIALWAQSKRGNITGIVTDPTGAAVPGAELTAVNTATNAITPAVASAAGEYNLPNLIPGTYHIEVTSAGFKRYVQQNVNVSAGGTVRVDATLQLGRVSEQVEVSAAAATIQTENAKVTTLVENKHMDLRYFDPTLSPARGHEDKSLIGCLMVKCAKVLIFIAGDRDGYGKDAEAAMALSLRKPVIFLCDEQARKDFFRDIHPLSRLIDFSSGLAVGAMATSSEADVARLFNRIFENSNTILSIRRNDTLGFAKASLARLFGFELMTGYCRCHKVPKGRIASPAGDQERS